MSNGYLLILTILFLPKIFPLQAYAARGNHLTMTEKSGVSTTNYPVQIGRPFAQGEIPAYPQAIVDGTPVTTQADIKQRWPDGSVKHAILSFLIPDLRAGGTVSVTFGNQPARKEEKPLERAEMLDGEFDFDAMMELTDSSGRKVSASARRMLESGAMTYWMKGPVTTSVILADHSAARAFDIGFDKHRSFRPIFHATFWPGIKKVRVRYVGEISNTEALQDMTYTLVLKAGNRLPKVVYSKAILTHFSATRWTKEVWLGGKPSEVEIRHGLEYLRRTFFVPNYDTSKAVPESAVISAYRSWLNAPKDLFDSGNWQKAMGTTGGRPEIGPYPSWTVRWLYTGDKRMEEMAKGNADLAGAWPVHFREGNPAKYLDKSRSVKGIGKVLSISTRPTIMFGAGNGYINYPYTKPEDRVVPLGSFSDGGWKADGAHQPDPFSPQYFLTGDFWYLEEMYFWASWSAAMDNGAATSYVYGRGPTGAEGGIADQTRGQAWRLRSRAHTAHLAPDGSPEKLYFTSLLEDAIAIWEGLRGLSGGPFDGNANWKWGCSMMRQKFGDLGVPPLNNWERGASAFVQDPLDAGIVKEAISPWEQNLVVFALGRAKELGFQTERLLSWVALNLIGQICHERYNPYLLSAYRLPTVYIDGSRYLSSWEEVRRGFKPEYDAFSYFDANLKDTEHGYTYMALAAASMIADEPGGRSAWEWMESTILQSDVLNYNPKWAIVPRSAQPTQDRSEGRINSRERPPKVERLHAR
ncbi:MAG: hypothetical protein C4576_27090 [Desulfobacteraceae bacterium]|nr:MAG: hypothetical protein C4576_27090 [Desulfobacteraceae bacterium]